MKNLLCVLAVLAIFTGCEQQAPVFNKGQANRSVQPGNQSPEEPIIPPDAQIAVTKNFYFVIDGSGSMNDAPSSKEERLKFKSKMQGAKQAMAEAISLIPKDANVGLFVFDRKGVKERVQLGSNKHEIVLKEVNEISANGGTPLSGSIRYGVDVLAAQRGKQLGYGEYRLIVVTDGEADSVPDAIAYANQNQIPIYGIGLGVQDSHPLRNGTIYSDAKSIEELTRALKETVGEMSDFDSSDLFK